ncbi:MAG: PAS domain S-box protein, partial [Deltaproteobacteria bacterium]|nr:PAS domain S-box protein [Deltaproteobacteria bacterium]
DYYDINISLIRDEEGKPTGFRSFSRDVTERFKTEQERERYREFIENIDDGCYEQDLQGNYTFVNEAACRRFGYTRDEFIGMNYSTMMSQETAKKMFALFNEVYRNGRTSDLIDFEIFTKNKKILHMQTMASLIWDHEGNPIGFRGISRDVTERFKMEKEQERYRNFLDNINDFCFERDLNGKMIFANEKWLKFFGITLEQTQQGGMGYHNFLTRETADKYDQIYMDVYRTGNPVDLYNFEMTFQDRESIYIDTSISLIRDENAKPTGFRVIARDVTRRKKMEDEREKLREKIVQSEKLESIGTLAGGIAHDFNNLLMGIQGYTSLMLMDIDPSHPFYEQLKIIESQVKNGADLTKQLLGYARRGRYEMKATNMNDLVKKTSYMFGRTKKDIRIHQNYADELWEIEADPGQMEQVFLNLFVNASEAMSGGGAIHLQSENVMLDEQYVKPHDIEPGRYIKISVTDTGVGMDEKTRERIFEPFFTTKDMGKGVGLGLASVYGIVKGHRGIINCYSEKGHGTTFNIYLPALTENNKFDEQAETNTMVNKQINILLVDDERTITDVTGTMLARLGYQVIIAHGGQEAVLTYRVNRDRIDLVIMDMIMPDMGGGDAIEKIKAINPEIKIILCSGYSINGMAREIIERAGVQGFLQKPFQVDQLIDKINEVMTSS